MWVGRRVAYWKSSWDVFQNFTVVCRFSLLNVPSDIPFLNKCLPICSEYINYLLSFIPFIMDVRERISFKPYLNAVFQYFRIERKPHLNYCQMSKRFKYKNVNPIKADWQCCVWNRNSVENIHLNRRLILKITITKTFRDLRTSSSVDRSPRVSTSSGLWIPCHIRLFSFSCEK